MGRIVAFGEVMLRMSAPGHELMLQTPRLDVWVGGAEANVVTALARLGHRAAMVTAVPPTRLGEAALTAMRGLGVECGGVERRAGRMGLYFVTGGSGARPGEVLYDRAHSAFIETPADAWDWDRLLDGADRLHLSGITPALGANGTAAALFAAAAATRIGVPVSFDGNYRSRLWDAWDGTPRATLAELVGHADILFGNHRDVGLLLGRSYAGETAENRRAAAEAAFAAFPRLRVIASTVRHADGADRYRLSARVDLRDGCHRTEEMVIANAVDRIGTGDAFAAGILHGLRRGLGPADVARQGLALAVLKHSVPGDVAPFGQEQIDLFLASQHDVQR